VLDGQVRETQLFNLDENPKEFLLQHHDPAVEALTGADPGPLQLNLADDPTYEAKLKEMEALLQKEMEKWGDPYLLWDAISPIAEDIRFTQKDQLIYAISLDVPESTTLNIHSLNKSHGIEPGAITKVSLLGENQELSWDQSEDGLVIHMQEIPDLKHAITFRIETN